MKKQIRLLMLSLMSIILLGGCNMFGKQDNIKLSEEYEALCNSKNTKNKQLCRETMNQLPKFENDVNAYFKEKFGIGDFVLTGINFPYGSFDHGGFNATFQLKSDRYVMITDTFDYKDGKYMIRAATNEDKSLAGQDLLASAIVLSKYFKKLPLEQIEKDLETLGITTNQENRLYYGLNSGRYFNKKNLISNSESAVVGLKVEEQIDVIKKYQENQGSDFFIYQERISNIQIEPLAYAKNEEELKSLYQKYVQYKKDSNQKIFINGLTCYKHKMEVDEIIIYTDEKGGIVIYG